MATKLSFYENANMHLSFALYLDISEYEKVFLKTHIIML